MVDIFNLTIPQLTEDEARTAYVYVPDGDPNRRYPVLYMFDGQNLFYDETASFGKSWGLLKYLEENHTPLIIASVACNFHREDHRLGGRFSEYSPFSFEEPMIGKIKGRGKITMDWLTQEFKAHIDANYPTLPDRDHTFIAGSSMGGLMTLYAILEYNRFFSRGAAVSPAMYFSSEEVKEMIRNSEVGRDTVLYMDYGEMELFDSRGEQIWKEAVRLLQDKRVLLESRIVPGGIHSEVTWEKQIPFIMAVLFYEL
ncbi:MAG: alpha/beta hydrolase [Eubacterium sp.]|nr:alpha/beta hydrolase [Eubacterium sp.]